MKVMVTAGSCPLQMPGGDEPSYCNLSLERRQDTSENILELILLSNKSYSPDIYDIEAQHGLNKNTPVINTRANSGRTNNHINL